MEDNIGYTGDSPANIDYIGILNYFERNREIPYSNPDDPSLSWEERNRLLEIKQNGQNAVNEMKKIAAEAADRFALNKCSPIKWLDGSNTKTRNYLWAQMRYDAYSDSHVSISLFVECNPEGAPVFRVSLELKDDDASPAEIDQYHKHLNMPLNSADGLVYVTGNNIYGRPFAINETAEKLKTKIAAGEIRRVQIRMDDSLRIELLLRLDSSL